MSDQGKLSNCEVDKKLFLGIKKVYDVAKKFYGPRLIPSSLTFLEERGYSVLSHMTLEDPHENAGADFAKAMANAIHKKHLDGATTGLILLYSILKESYVLINQGLSAYKLSLALQKKSSQLLEHLHTYSWPVKDPKKIKDLVLTALRYPSIAENISSAVAAIGPSGCISTTRSYQIDLQVTQGIKIDFGYTSTYFISDPLSRTTTLSFPYILILDQKISSIHRILLLLKEISQNHKHLLIFCEDIDKDVLATLIVNKLRKLLQVTVVTIPELSTKRQNLAKDLALFTGTHVYSQDADLSMTMLGSCASAEISETQTLLIYGQHVPEVLALKIRQLDEEIRTTTSPEEKLALLERKQRLQGSLVLITTKEETEPLYTLGLRLANSAKEHGYLPGGGVSLLYASLSLDKDSLSTEELAATHILQTACRAPLEQLILNSQADCDVVINKLKSLATASMGFNVLSQEIEDLIAGGVLDSLATISTALSCATETAITVFSSKVIT